MKLRRLSLHGFKSFADHTHLDFHEGITAIVGPNGCGKSNISDAIRWVLGEQRASAIRGSKMEEAIFQGTTERRAVNRAEVSLLFSNLEKRLALPHDEVEIRRTVFREGGSDYALNRTACRLRDIYDLFRDTGLGTNAYAVIEQGMVDSILSERADERRHMFEEAAGIGRYKDRRKAAQRRLDAAEADLNRLEDLLTEVESKVRSLKRQKNRAEKYQELRTRRLSLEVRVASDQLEDARRRLAETTARLERLAQDEPSARAALATAETELERLRLEAGELARERGVVAQKVEEATRAIAGRERELAVADERRAGAERRLQQIAIERAELAARATDLDAALETLEAEVADERSTLAARAAAVERAHARQTDLRAELARVRRAEEEARTRETELTRRLARLEADASAADVRALEAESRLEQLGGEAEELAGEVARLDDQGDLFASRTHELTAAKARLEKEVAGQQASLERLRADEMAERRALSEAEDRVGRLNARLAALDALERDHHGFAPAVAAALDARAELEGLKGPLAEYLDLPPERAAAVEGTLGSLLQALVVDDDAAADRIRLWLTGAHAQKGALALIQEAGLPRVAALLEVIEFVGRPPEEPVLIGRRERLIRLRSEAAHGAGERDARAEARAAAAERIAEAEVELRAAAVRLQEADLELRRAESDEAARRGEWTRASRARDELSHRREQLRGTIQAARDAAIAAREEHARVLAELEAGEDRPTDHAGVASELEAAWQAASDAEAEVRIGHARTEAAVAALERRIAGARESIQQAERRTAALAAEDAGMRAELEHLSELRSGAGEDLEALFGHRDAGAAELRALDERHAAAAGRLEALESEARALRRSTEEKAEDRHRLELEKAEAGAAERSVRERLEAEWGRPYAQLVARAEPVEGDPEVLRAELHALAADIERLGPINMLAVEEFGEESARLEFLTAQRQDLVKARDDLQTAIRQINRTARQLFADTFDQIRQNFQRTFLTLFEGGECDIRLADPDDPLESEIDIAASPRGKKTHRIHLLSGGERALTALALLFAIYLVKPSPFCVLDEVDAPLDEANIGRFLAMLAEFKSSTQFIVITHNPRTMEAADWIYGVTMEEPGISSIVGVRLDEVLTDVGVAAG